ncbi:MAG: transcriptional repressor [Oscillospiraceae bacterium]|nr:transcriptional repressor [Oscillospiraceae bacterium]
MPAYSTRQRKALLNFLSGHPDELFSARQIAEALENEGISLSAVYRNLSELEAEGKLRRSGRGGAREVFYQYTDAEGCRECLHLSCTKCGRTLHMDGETARRLTEQLALKDGFELDRGESVLYGLCARCK